jgi:hypothetical protein
VFSVGARVAGSCNPKSSCLPKNIGVWAGGRDVGCIFRVNETQPACQVMRPSPFC